MPQLRPAFIFALLIALGITATITALLSSNVVELMSAPAVGPALGVRTDVGASSQPQAVAQADTGASGDDDAATGEPDAPGEPDAQEPGAGAVDTRSGPGSLRAAAPDAGTESTLTVNETYQVLASLQVEIGGEIHQLSIPATLLIDTIATLDGTTRRAARDRRVGILEWRIVAIEEYDSEYQVSQFTTVTASSPNNKLVVVHSLATNLGRAPFNFTRGLREELAYDALGNVYGSTRRSCDDINPGATGNCTLIFDVPAQVTITGLDLGVVDYKRIPFPSGE